jgi:hypothetical protein
VDVAGTGRPLNAWVGRLAEEGLLVTTVAGRARMLTHLDVTAQDVDAALAAWRTVAAEFGVLSSASAR